MEIAVAAAIVCLLLGLRALLGYALRHRRMWTDIRMGVAVVKARRDARYAECPQGTGAEDSD